MFLRIAGRCLIHLIFVFFLNPQQEKLQRLPHSVPLQRTCFHSSKRVTEKMKLSSTLWIGAEMSLSALLHVRLEDDQKRMKSYHVVVLFLSSEGTWKEKIIAGADDHTMMHMSRILSAYSSVVFSSSCVEEVRSFFGRVTSVWDHFDSHLHSSDWKDVWMDTSYFQQGN